MNKGRGIYNAVCGGRVKIMADQEFTAYGLEDGKRVVLLGPFRAGERYLDVVLPAHVFEVEVVCSDDCLWDASWTGVAARKESPDSRPVAIPAGLKRPPTLAEDMRRMIRQELSARAAEVGEESFEEADDFRDEDEEAIYSPHELTEENLEFELDAEVKGEGDGFVKQGGKEDPARSSQKSDPVVDPQAVVPGKSSGDTPAVSGEGG